VKGKLPPPLLNLGGSTTVEKAPAAADAATDDKKISCFFLYIWCCLWPFHVGLVIRLLNDVRLLKQRKAHLISSVKHVTREPLQLPQPFSTAAAAAREKELLRFATVLSKYLHSLRRPFCLLFSSTSMHCSAPTAR